ncbi:MAG: hybrid sensor histidine kinase/response regulator [Snowella sp.]|nr:hybrid sensor histidine kinase/response regulator [Snowella sp.]
MLDAATLEAITQEARQAFLDEDAPECLSLLTTGLQQLEGALLNASAATLKPIYKDLGRAAHSLKGGAGMAALPTLQQLCHSMEDLFDTLEKGQGSDTATALGLLSLATEEVQNLIDLAMTGQSDPGDGPPPEIAVALAEFLTTCTSQEEEVMNVGEVSDFIKTALSLELEACLEKVEQVLVPSANPNLLVERFKVLAEECTLLGQALSCPWLEQVITHSHQVQSQGILSLAELTPLTIAELRRLRSQFLAGQEPILSEEFQNLLPSPEKLPEPEGEIPTIAESPTAVPSTVIPVLSKPVSPPSEIAATPSPFPRPTEPATARQNLRIPLERVTRMSNTVSELLINHERLLIYDKQLRQASRNLKQRSQQLVPMREQVESLYDELTFSEQTNNSNSPKPHGLSELAEFDALEFDSYTSVHTILQRFQELMVQVQEIQEDIDLVERDLQETLIHVRQSLDSLDEDLTQSRLVPFGALAKSFIQPLEKLSQRHQKSVRLEIVGESILVELVILEQLRTPLTHLIRNAFDHGLEFPKERQALGKNKEGTITLAASIASNQVMLTITDDGRGVNLAKIRQRAIALGLISEKDTVENSREKLLDCLFSPGFSTATNVSELSGRGLGLDIVKHLVESLRGTIRLETQEGKGSRFIIRIPLTLNILPVLLVRSQQKVLALPSQSVLRMLPLADFPLTDGFIEWENQRLSVRSLHELLSYSPLHRLESKQVKPNNVGLMVVVNGQNVIIAIEEVIDERPLVVKALDPITPLPSFLTGCAVLGTGEVVPILIPENFDSIWQQQRSHETRSPLHLGPASRNHQRSILVIDDSITVRRTLQRILTRSGYEIIQCRDGKEAWELLNRQNEGIDLAICDLEMPNMDGFSLLQLIRHHAVWKSLPVVVLTSRENELHRQRAMGLGANNYLTKPFQPNKLLELVGTFIED